MALRKCPPPANPLACACAGRDHGLTRPFCGLCFRLTSGSCELASGQVTRREYRNYRLRMCAISLEDTFSELTPLCSPSFYILHRTRRMQRRWGVRAYCVSAAEEPRGVQVYTKPRACYSNGARVYLCVPFDFSFTLFFPVESSSIRCCMECRPALALLPRSLPVCIARTSPFEIFLLRAFSRIQRALPFPSLLVYFAHAR